MCKLIFDSHECSFLIYILYIISFRAVVGEVDEDLDKQIDLSIIRAEPLQQITH